MRIKYQKNYKKITHTEYDVQNIFLCSHDSENFLPFQGKRDFACRVSSLTRFVKLSFISDFAVQCTHARKHVAYKPYCIIYFPEKKAFTEKKNLNPPAKDIDGNLQDV